MTTTPCSPTLEFNPFSRVDDAKSLTSEELLTRFEETGFVWFQLHRYPSRRDDTSDVSSTAKDDSQPLLPTGQAIIKAMQRHPQACEKNWTVENRGTLECDQDLTVATLLEQSDQSFYVSTIVHLKDSEAFTELHDLLPNQELNSILEDLHIASGLWLFIGHHAASEVETAHTTEPPLKHSSKRLKVGSREPMIGRAEHVDEVTYAGTFHIQISGTKTWFVRPHSDLFVETNPTLPDLSKINGAERSPKTGAWRLKIEVQQGDVFVLNTKIWYHYTELSPPTQRHQKQQDKMTAKEEEEWSMSVARDFYLPIPCPKTVSKGEVIFEEDEVPDDIPQTETPNCALIEIDDDEGDENDDEDDNDAADASKIVLVALEDIQQGHLLSIAHENSEDQGAECNANEMIDPRAFAKVDWEQGQVVLRGEDIPDELPRSMEPNCELQVTDNGQVELRALQRIDCGNVFSVLPEEDEEYEQVEVDLSTGEFFDRH
jgi:hypothetical protein